MRIEQTLTFLRRARAHLDALPPDEVHARNAAFPVARSLEQFDAGAPLAERFPTAETLFAALDAEDPTVLVFALQLLAAMGPVAAAAATALALEVMRAWDDGGNALDRRARRSAAMVLDAQVHTLALDEVVTWVLAGRLSASPALAAHPQLAEAEAQRGLLRDLERASHDPAAPASRLRNIVLQSLMAARDPETLEWLFVTWQDETHAFSPDAAQWLLRSGDTPTLRRMAALADHAFSGALSEARRWVLLRAIIESGDPARLHAHVVPRLVGDASVLSQLTQAVRNGRIPKDDARLAAAVLPLLAVGAVKGPAKALLASMDQRTVKAAGTTTGPTVAVAAVPGPQRGDRAEFEATLRRFGHDVEQIVAVLKRARYPFRSKRPLPPARPDAEKKLAALIALTGPLPPAVEVFYTLYDGVDLGQAPDAVIPTTQVLSPCALDELGRCDPLIVVPLAALLADAQAIAKRNKGLAETLRAPVHPYLSPDPRSKGMGDDIADERPVRLDPGAGDQPFLDWLRRYVAAGGFLALASAEDRAVLTRGLGGF